MKDIEEIIAELRADGVTDEAIFADLRESDGYVKAHPEEFANRETLMQLNERIMRERLERRQKKRRRTR